MPLPYPRLETERLIVLLPGPDFARRILDYYRANEEHLREWEPRRSAEFWTEDWWVRQLERNQREFREDGSARLVLLLRGDPERVIGVANPEEK